MPDHSGIIVKRNRQNCLIWTGDETIQGTISTRLQQGPDAHSVAVGDAVTWGEAGQITAVMPRRNWLSRRGAASYTREQIIVANVDQVIPVLAAAHPRPAWNLLDRVVLGRSVGNYELPVKGLLHTYTAPPLFGKPQRCRCVTHAYFRLSVGSYRLL